jgi:uncharacterized membrane protein
VRASDRDSGRRLGILISLLAAAALGSLLWHLIYRGLPHSFDPLIYSRAIWGIARFDFFDPVMFVSVFGIHGQFVQFLLAPLTWLMPPAMVLILAQAVALGVTVWLSANAFGDASARDGSSGFAVVAGALLTLASPLVLNAFLFDVRPEMIGIPLILAGLLRVERRDDFDGVAMALLLASLAVREDYAIIICPAILLMPATRGFRIRTRIIAAAGALAYLALYLFVFRRLLGGTGLVQQGFQTLIGKLLDPAADSAQRASLWDLLRYKGEILLIAACSMGGFAIRGRRWLLLSVPGLVLLLAQNRLQPWILNTHYSIFVAPALIVAGVDGYRRWVRNGRPQSMATVTIAIVAAAGGYLLSSAAPGGGRYLEQRFGWSPLHPLQTSGVPPALVPIRQMLDSIPSDEGLIVPYAFGAPLAGRRVIHAAESLPLSMLKDGRVPDGVEWVALLPPSWGYGRMLVERRGFVVYGQVPRSMVLLARKKGPG